MDVKQRAELVEALVLARRRGKQISSVNASWKLESENEAEGVMLDVARLLDWDPLGWKVAATNHSIQSRLRVDGPVFGRTYSRHLSKSPSSFIHKDVLDPIVECEFMFKMKGTLHASDAPHTPESVLAAVDAVYPGIEVGECRLFGAAHVDTKLLMADAFGSGRYVVGRPLQDGLARLEHGIDVTLYRNGVKRAEGSSHAVLGNPLRSVTWLANRLAMHGLDLAAGELVSSGSCTGMTRARAGDKMVAEFDGQAIEVCFE